MWLVAHKRCWTADRLARRALPHPERCPLCHQEDEDIHHLLISCVLARQFWFLLLHFAGMSALAPQPNEPSFDEWWKKIEGSVGSDMKKGINSLFLGPGPFGAIVTIVCLMDLLPNVAAALTPS